MERPFTSVGYKWTTALEGEVKAGKEGKVPRLDKQTMFGQSRWGLELCQFQIQWRFSWFCFSTARLDGRVLEMFSQDLWSLNRWSFPKHFLVFFHNCVNETIFLSWNDLRLRLLDEVQCVERGMEMTFFREGDLVNHFHFCHYNFSVITFTFAVITFNSVSINIFASSHSISDEQLQSLEPTWVVVAWLRDGRRQIIRCNTLLKSPTSPKRDLVITLTKSPPSPNPDLKTVSGPGWPWRNC